MKTVNLIVIAIFTLILSACSLDSEAIAKLAKVTAEAKVISDPWAAYKHLKQSDAVAESIPSGRNTPEVDRFITAKENSLLAAAKSGNADALVIAADKIGYFNDDQKKAIYKALLASASTAKGTPADAVILYLAGNIISNGNYIIRDVELAASYYARAWAAGSPTAAGQASSLYASVEDYRNAYLWGLRCIDGCKRASSLLGDLEQHLTPGTILKIQRLAQDSSIANVGEAK